MTIKISWAIWEVFIVKLFLLNPENKSLRYSSYYCFIGEKIKIKNN